jgi:hypothetical protein
VFVLGNIKTDLNKLTKDALSNLCEKHGVQVPAAAKTKAAIIDFMIGATWPSPLETLLAEDKPADSPAKGKKAAVKSGVDDKIIEEINQKIAWLTEQVTKLQAGSGIAISSNKATTAPLIDENVIKNEIAAKTAPLVEWLKKIDGQLKAFAGSKNEITLEQEMAVLEGITDTEFTPLDDIFEFVEDLPKIKFLQIIKKLLFYRLLEGEESEGNINIEMPDGTSVGSVKRRE